MRYSRAVRSVEVLLLCASLLLPAMLMRKKSMTSDELAHIPAGYSYLVTRMIRLNRMHPPLVKELSALPLLALGVRVPVDRKLLEDPDPTFSNQWTFGRQFFRGQDVERLLFWARLPAVLLSAGLAAVVMIWAAELWGGWGGVLALFLYVFDPTITAHAQLVTTDVGLAFFATLFLFVLRRYLRSPSGWGLIVSGITLGLALGAKFSAVTLVPTAALLVLAARLGGERSSGGAQPTVDNPARIRRLLSASLDLAVLATTAYLVLWALYFFPTDPLFYLEGMRSVNADHDPRHLFLVMGDLILGRCPYYLLVAWLVKTPIPSLILLGASLVLFLRGRGAAWLDEAFLVVPAFGFFVANSLFAAPVGVRYLIPCFPLFFVFAGRLAPMLGTASHAIRTVLAALLVWYVAEFVAIWPDHLSYFNEIAGGSAGGLWWLDDSNVDWGQGLIELREHLEAHPVGDYRLCYAGSFDFEAYGIHAQEIDMDSLTSPPPPGTLILSANCVARLQAWLTHFHGDGPANWLAHVRPIAVIGHAYYVYAIGS